MPGLTTALCPFNGSTQNLHLRISPSLAASGVTASIAGESLGLSLQGHLAQSLRVSSDAS